MKYLLFSDVHWSSTSSMVNMRGVKYTKRLELLINSLNWIEAMSIKLGCDKEICLGDFCDKNILNDEEISALREIKWNDIPKAFIVGNHESGQHDLKFSTVKAIEEKAKIEIIDKPIRLDEGNISFYYVPYIVESDRDALQVVLDRANKDYLTENKTKVIFSHNDIAGQNYAGFISQIGFSIDEIEKACTLYLNGHLHNSQWVSKKILNVGSLSAHNFTNDSNIYKYGIWVLDTETLKLDFIENPYSLAFYKLDILSENDLEKLSSLKDNACVSIRHSTKYGDQIKTILTGLGDNIIASRLVAIREMTTTDEVTIQDLQSDHLEMLVKFCTDNLPNTEVLKTELAEICK